MMSLKMHSKMAVWQHLPEYLLLVSLKSTSYESVVVVMRTLFARLLICDVFGWTDKSFKPQLYIQ